MSSMSKRLAVVAEVVSHVTSRRQTNDKHVPATELIKTFLGIGADFTACITDIQEQAKERYPHASVQLVHAKSSFKF